MVGEISKVIDKKFIEDYSNRYDRNVSKRDRKLEEKIIKKLNKLFPSGSVKYIKKDILFNIVDWKAPRIRNRVRDNKKEFVEEVTKHCFSSLNEQFKIEGLTILRGVDYRVASAILHFCFPSLYIIMDYRAWGTLEEQKYLPKKYDIKDDFEHWQRYLNVCRKISKRCDYSLRQLDKALWQYSKEKQE